MSALPLALIEEPAEKFVRFTLMYSPFDMSDAEYAQLVWAKEKPLTSYLDGLPNDIDWVITVNGMIVTEDEFATRTLTPEDLLLICPLPHGGGGGKQIFRIVALIAIAILAPYAAAGIATLAGAAGAVAATATTAAAAAGSIAAATAGLGVVGFGLLSASIVLAGSLLVNTLLPPPTPKVAGQATFDESPTYGVDGAKNTSSEGVPVPLVYGEHQVAGNIASLFTENEGDAQIVYVQSVLSEGPIESVTNIQLNDQALSVYENVTSVQQLGDAVNAPSDWFNRSVTMKSVSLKAADTTWITQTTDSEIDQFRIDVTFSSGLFAVNSDNGNLQNASVQFAIEYRKQGASSWIAMVDNGMVNKSTSSLFLLRAKGVKFDVVLAGSPQIDPVAPRPYDIEIQYRLTTEAGAPFGEWQGIKRIQGVTTPYYTYYGRDGHQRRLNENTKIETIDHDFGKTANVELRFVVVSGSYTVRNFFERGNATNNGLTITAARRNPVRASFYSPQVPEGVYEVRLKRTTAESTATTVSDQVYWSDLAQIVYEEVAYKNTAWLGIRAKLSDQFNGIPKITSIVRGIKCRRYNLSGQFIDRVWTQNPAWITLDILIDDDHGAGLPLTRVDLASFARWAAECEARNFKFNGVFDYQSNFWDALQTVCRVGHAQILQTGTIYSIVMEKADDPVMVFSDANIISGSLNLTWLPVADRANEVEVTYIDKDDGYRQRMIRHFDPEAQQRGERPKTSQVSLQGVTSADQAWFEAHFMLAQNKYVLRTAQWDTSLEAIGCTIGDVVLLQTSMMHWATAGRLAAGSAANTLMLDRPVTMEVGKSYKVLVHKPAMLRHTATTLWRNTTSRQVALTGVPVNPERLTRMTIGTNDYEIIYVVSQIDGKTILQLDRVTSIASGGGQTALLYDTDVIMEANVVPVVGDNITALTLADDLPATPEEFSNFLFGETALVKQPFRVIGITGSHEYVRTIKAAEYNASIYADPTIATPLPAYRPITGIPPVNDLTYGVRYFLVDRVYQARITLNWNAPSYDKSVIVGADIWTSQIDGDWEKVATVSGTTYAFTQHDSDDLYVRVVPFAADGTRSAFNDASTITVEGVSNVDSVPGPTSVTTLAGPSSVGLKWDNPAIGDLTHTVIERSAAPFSTWVEIGKVAAPGRSYTDVGLLSGVYRYRIRSLDSGGRESDWVTSADVLVDAAQYADVIPPAAPTGLTVNQIVVPRYGSYVSALAVAWGANSESDFSYYILRVTESGVTQDYVTTEARYNFGVIEGRTYAVRVAAVDRAGNVSPFSVEINHTVVADIAPPGPPSGLVVNASFKTIALSWTNPTDADLAGIELWASATNNRAAATVVWSGLATSFVHQIGTSNVNRYYWVRAYDAARNYSTYFPASATAGVFGTTLRAVTEDLTDAAITASKIAAGVIDATKLASSISAVEIVTALPATGNYEGRIVYLTSDGKLYRYKSGAWTAAVSTVDLTGQITNAQIVDSAITAVKIATSAIDSSKIAANAVTTAKIAASAVDAGKLAAASVDQTKLADAAVVAAKIADGAVTGQKIADATVQATKFAAGIEPVAIAASLPNPVSYIGPKTVFNTTDGKLYRYVSGAWTAAVATVDLSGQVQTAQIVDSAITAVKIATAAIDDTKIAANAVTTAKIAANAVDAGKIAAAAVGSTHLANLAVTAAKVADNAVTTAKIADAAIATGKLAANAVDSTKIADAAIQAAKIAANAVTATKLAIGDYSNLVPDEKMSEDAAWVLNSAVFVVPANSSWRSARVMELPVSATSVIYRSKAFGVESGSKIFIAAQTLLLSGSLGTSTTTGQLTIRVRFLSGADGTGSQQIAVVGNVTASALTDISTIVTVPVGYKSAQLEFMRSAGGDAIYQVGGCIARRSTTSELIADAAITTSKIANGAISAASFASGIAPVEIVAVLPTAGNFQGRVVFLTTDNKLYRRTDSGWTAAVSTVDLTGQITNAQIVDSAITAVKIATAAIDDTKIAASAVTTAKIAASAVDAAKIAANAVGSTHLTDLAVTAAKIADAAISTAKIADAAISAGKLAANAVDSAKLADAAVTAGKIATGAIDAGHFSSGARPVEIVTSLPGTGNFAGRFVFLTTDGKLYRHTGSAWTAAVPAVDVTGQLVGTQIADSAITAVKIATSAIDDTKIAANAVTTAKIADAAIQAAKIAASAIGSTHISDLAITSAKVADNAISTIKIVSGAVDAGKIAASAVDSTKLADNAVTAAKLASGAIDATKFASGVRPVEILSALPSIGNFQGRMVLLTADSKLYRHTGSIWTSAVPATDLTGQITNAQIVDSAITAVKIATSAIDSSKIAANAVTVAAVADGAIEAAKIATAAVDATKLAAGAVTTAKFAAGIEPVSVVSALPSPSGYTGPRVVLLTIDSKLYRHTGSIWVATIPTTDLTGQIVNGQVAANAIDATQLVSAAVTNAKIAAAAVTANKLSVRRHFIY